MSYSFKDLMKKAEESGDVPVGWYDVKVIKSEAVKASSGVDMIDTTYEVTEGEYETRFIFDHHPFPGDKAGSWQVAQFLKALDAMGADEDFLLNDPSPEKIASYILDNRLRVKVEKQKKGDYKGRIQVADYAKAGTSSKNALGLTKTEEQPEMSVNDTSNEEEVPVPVASGESAQPQEGNSKPKPPWA